MKKRILIFGVVIIVLAISYYVFQMLDFAKGVQDDVKRRQEFMNKKEINADSLRQLENDSLK